MNKKNDKYQKQVNSPMVSEEARGHLRHEIHFHAENLAENLNLRMIQETDGGELLFVESLVVSEIYFPAVQEQNSMSLWKTVCLNIKRFLSRFNRKQTETANLR